MSCNDEIDEEFFIRGHRWSKHRGYLFRTVTLHQEIWESYYGPVPQGCSIHHRDRNRNNNEIDNLECLPEEYHGYFHRYEEMVEFTCIVCGKRTCLCKDAKGNRFCSKKCLSAYHNLIRSFRTGKYLSARFKTYFSRIGVPLMLPYLQLAA